jgi:hypothetical protein
MITLFDALDPNQKRLSHVLETIQLSLSSHYSGVVNQYVNPLSRSGQEPLVGRGPFLSQSFARPS